VPEWPNGAAC